MNTEVQRPIKREHRFAMTVVRHIHLQLSLRHLAFTHYNQKIICEPSSEEPNDGKVK